jgi:hypothetical protein
VILFPAPCKAAVHAQQPAYMVCQNHADHIADSKMPPLGHPKRKHTRQSSTCELLDALQGTSTQNTQHQHSKHPAKMAPSQDLITSQDGATVEGYPASAQANQLPVRIHRLAAQLL